MNSQSKFEKINGHSFDESFKKAIKTENGFLRNGDLVLESKLVNGNLKEGLLFPFDDHSSSEERTPDDPVMDMSTSPRPDSKEYLRATKEAVKFVLDYLENAENYPLFSSVDPWYLKSLLPSEAPEKPENLEVVLRDVKQNLFPGMNHWHHPHYHAYYPHANSYPAMCGEILSMGLGCLGFTWATSPACTELEIIVMDWLAKAIGLPKCFLSDSKSGGGVIYSSACDAVIMVILAARNKTIDEYIEKFPGTDKFWVLSKLIAYCSDETHSSVRRAALFGMLNMKIVETVDRKLRASVLEATIEEDIKNGYIPFFCTATLGTTSSIAFDPLDELGPLCKKYNVWLHVDAAYAGSSFVCPEFREPLNGVEHAMSFVINPHKWLLMNYDCSAVWFQQASYVADSFRVDPIYLHHKNKEICREYRHWSISLSRKFRSLKMWFVLRLYGISGLQSYIRNHVRLAHVFEELILSDGRFEIVEKVTTGVVCFRLYGTNQLNEMLFSEIEKSKKIKILMVSFSQNGLVFLRFAVCYQFATDDHIRYAYEAIVGTANKMNIPKVLNNFSDSR